MNFAKNILGKYGWKDGDGLGREKQGIKKPIKANLKFDQAGLGADPSREFSNNWWERAFNDAAKNVQVTKQKNGEISVDLKDANNSVEVTTKSYSVKKLTESGALYGKNFLSEDVSFNSFAITESKNLTDEELFRACGGRTAHKGARHGLKLSGKLARLEQQEKELLAKMQARVNGEEPNKPEDGNNSTRISKESSNINESTSVTHKNLKRKSKDEQTEVSREFDIEVVNDTKKSKRKKKYKDTTEDCPTEESNETEQISKRVKSKKKKKDRQTD